MLSSICVCTLQGEADFLGPDNIISTLSMANYYGVSSLKQMCGKIPLSSLFPHLRQGL